MKGDMFMFNLKLLILAIDVISSLLKLVVEIVSQFS